MRQIWLAACLLLAVPAGAEPPGSEATDWIGVGGASAERVPEPVFGGRVMLYRAGPRDADAVVLIHGLGNNAARDWSKVIPALAESYAVYALDLPGFGQSDKGNHLYSPENYVRAIDAVLAERVPRPFALIGHSMGGAIALAYAAAYPRRVRRLIVVDAAGVLLRSVYAEFLGRAAAERAIGMDSPRIDALLRLIQNYADSLPAKSDIVLENAEVRRRLLRGDPGAIAALALTEHDLSRALRSITAPTLVIWGSDDKVAPLRTGEVVAGVIPGARLVVIPGAGHEPHLEKPQRFNAIVLDELRGRLEAKPYALRRAKIQGGRTARCVGERGQEFSGDYERLILDNCADVEITDARIGFLRATSSTVRIVNSQIRDGVGASGSRLELTAGVVGGSPPLMLYATSVDAAGTRFESEDVIAANRGSVPVTLRLSVTEMSRANAAPRYVHDIIRLAPGQDWKVPD
jgi:pimeloyl-ACP methyl ester carboxylesterase